MTTEIVESWYNSLIEDCKDLITEVEFSARWTLVEGYHSLGSRIISEGDNFNRVKVYGQEIVQRIAESLQRKPRTIYYAIQFASKYPDLNLLPEGKNTSWHHIINKYLTDGTEKKVAKKADLYRMIKEIKELLNTEYLKAKQAELDDGLNLGHTHFIQYLQDQFNKIVGEL
jgi:hypothetical protein